MTRPSAPIQLRGLTSDEVAARAAAGDINTDAGIKTRSIADIFRDNICTLFNFVNVVLAVLVFVTGSYKNMLFMIVIVANVAIGIIQEIRSKLVTDRLAIVAASKATVLRDGQQREIPIDQLVKGDVIRLSRGDQVPSDAKVLDGSCKVDESLLTGESKAISKDAGDLLMSGSFLNAGTVWAEVVHVGADNYASKITAEAKRHKAINSEIMTSLNSIIKFVSIAMLPIGLLLFAHTYIFGHVEFNSALLTTVSALVGMIPEGLILLTSTVLAVAVVRLAGRKVLVQQLYCIETLARVDTLCLDKTGTITSGRMKVTSIQGITDNDEAHAASAARAIALADADPNDTAEAIRTYFSDRASGAKPDALTAGDDVNDGIRFVPFSSETKLSGVVLADGHAFAMGAAQFVLASHPDTLERILPEINRLAQRSRVLLVAQVGGFDATGHAQGDVTPLGFILLEDEVRSTAAETIRYFIEQGVTLKVISGDDPHTVSGIAERVGVPHAGKYVDCSTLQTSQELQRAIEEYSVFGRVTPEQKKEFVTALQQDGHIVAMTGDGVNDVLALKASDCSIAMASGSDAARNVAQLVLVDNDFASMPHVVAEGRRSINNLQRSASLFLVKTLFSIVSALLFILLPWQYPFVPIQMTLISAFTIGIPSFVLALEPNHDRVRGHFLENCVVRSIPGAICAVVSVVAISIVGEVALGLSYAQASTLCVMMFAFIGVLLVIRLSIPYNAIRVGLLVVVLGGLVLGFTVLAPLFDLAPLTPTMWAVAGIGAAVNLIAFQLLYNLLGRMHERHLAEATPRTSAQPDERHS